jgi:hypothetical protein
MPYLLAALLLIAFGVMLWRAWRLDRDVTALLKGAVLVGAGVFLSAFARSMLVYKPLMVLHIAATLLYWYALLLYLTRREVKWPFLVAPVATALLFFAVAWLFREV